MVSESGQSPPCNVSMAICWEVFFMKPLFVFAMTAGLASVIALNAAARRQHPSLSWC